jgi:putative ABC transport system substrate-binding protein
MSITSAIPVVFASGDPVAAGLAASLARPGRNGTGVSAVTPELSAKNLDLLHQIVPHLKRVAYLQGPVSPLHARHVNEMHAAAKTLRVELQVFSAHSADELDKSLKSIQAGRFDGLVVSSDLLTLTYGERIARAARRARLPAIYPWRDYHEHGALVSYGVSGRAVTQRMARYVDRILRGADPGDLPVEENSTFELVVDLREAAAIGVTVPQSILLRADEVIR